ncbi:cupin domain-containing protein [Catenulispora rubra]|uniref:cupin domain-containing protein n=1 Tax=Catenulispora rubra TaxID=280293 RepID=UPI0018923027|nr:cupin domain-containing protein [Catenulispora rubra]
MLITEIDTVPRRRAPVPGGPTAVTLTAPDTSAQVAVVHLEIPADGGMPEHDHGVSEVVLIPLSGSLELWHDGRPRTLAPGMTAHIAAGERVSLANSGSEPACLMAVVSPPQFAERLAAWPLA